MRTALLIAIVALAGVASGCSGSGPLASGSPPAPVGVGGSAVPVQPTASAVAGSPSPAIGSEEPTVPPEPSATPQAVAFVMHSSAFDDGGAIPRRYTCDGADTSPEVAWSGAPQGTRSFAVIVRDPDAGGFVHWVAYDIPGSADGTLPTGVSRGPSAPAEGRNGFGRIGWGGPCPPSGTHRYVFTLYAVDRELGLTGGVGLAALQAAMRGHVLAQATLTGRYKRG
jgi:Raf kinase inhibitor-like YbhB/YbcL family protein